MLRICKNNSKTFRPRIRSGFRSCCCCLGEALLSSECVLLCINKLLYCSNITLFHSLSLHKILSAAPPGVTIKHIWGLNLWVGAVPSDDDKKKKKEQHEQTL